MTPSPKKGIIGIAVLALLALLYAAAFTVDETEQVVVTRFGRIVRDPITTPGLKFKVPFIDQANRFRKNLLHWDGDPGQIPTSEKTYIWVDAFARWKITDPVDFLLTVTDEFSAIQRLNDILDPAVRNLITSNRLIEAVRRTNRALDIVEINADLPQGDIRKQAVDYDITIGREELANRILKQAQPKLDKFGIELVDVKFKRINYVDTVRESVYKRMIAERKQIAEKFRSEGKGEAQKIIGQKERDLKEIQSNAYRRAQKIRGKADAEATRIFADAFGVDREFYSFTKTLEMYKQALESNSGLVISTDSEFFRYLKTTEDPAAQREARAGASSPQSGGSAATR
ncbi:MAG: protease modulator HflC [Desulfococcaceae bacterium]